MIDFRVNTFLAVCKHMNYTRAAEELHITQPAVSQHIKYLEEFYATQLFFYEGKRVELSSSGRLLLQIATAWKNDQKFFDSQIHQRLPSEVPLNFGVTITIGEFIIAKPLAEYMKRHPDSRIRMVLGNTNYLLSEMKESNIHFALVEGYFSSKEYDYLSFSTEEFICVCSASYKLNYTSKPLNESNEEIALHNLLKEHLLVREIGSGTRDILEKNLIARNLSIDYFTHISEINSMHAIVQLLLRGCGISFLYKSAVVSELQSGRLVEISLSDFQLQNDFNFIWEKKSAFGNLYHNIFQELRSYE